MVGHIQTVFKKSTPPHLNLPPLLECHYDNTFGILTTMKTNWAVSKAYFNNSPQANDANAMKTK